MKSIEHDEQVTLMKWWALIHHRFGISEQLLFAIPNGGQRNLLVATKLKAEGVRAGVPDLFLAVRRSGFGGLFIEMKKPKGGRVSDNQKTMITLLEEQGYKAIVCKGWIEAKQHIEDYLSEKGEHNERQSNASISAS